MREESRHHGKHYDCGGFSAACYEASGKSPEGLMRLRRTAPEMMKHKMILRVARQRRLMDDKNGPPLIEDKKNFHWLS